MFQVVDLFFLILNFFTASYNIIVLLAPLSQRALMRIGCGFPKEEFKVTHTMGTKGLFGVDSVTLFCSVRMMLRFKHSSMLIYLLLLLDGDRPISYSLPLRR